MNEQFIQPLSSILALTDLKVVPVSILGCRACGDTGSAVGSCPSEPVSNQKLKNERS